MFLHRHPHSARRTEQSMKISVLNSVLSQCSQRFEAERSQNVGNILEKKKKN